MRETLSRNEQRLLLLSMPHEEAVAQEILWKLEQAWPHSTLTDAVAWWELDEPEGVCLDATGRGNDLTTVVGTPSFVLGPDGASKAVALDGASYLMCTVVPGGDLTCGPSDFTVAGWALANDFSNNRVFWSWTQALGTNILRVQFINTTGEIRVAAVPTSSLVPATGTWYFVILEINYYAGTRTIIVREPGGQTYTDTAAGSVDVSLATEFAIGYTNLGVTAYHQGAVQKVAKWNRLLTDAEKQVLFNRGRGIRWPGRRIRVLRG